MTQYQKVSMVFLRVTLGWMFFYAGITKIMDPAWSAAGYMKSAKLFSPLFQWLASPALLPITNFVNEWGLTLLGVSLMLGIGVGLSTKLGAVLMVLYYLPLGFPYPNAHAFIVDEHILYVGSLLLLGSLSAGRVWGLENWCSNLPICAKYPALRKWIG